MVLEVTTDPLGARFSLAPFDEWLAAFQINQNRYRIEAQYYPRGVPDRPRVRERSSRPRAAVRTILDSESRTGRVRLSGAPRSEPPDALCADTIETGEVRIPLATVSKTVTQFMDWIDPEHDFTALPVPPLRSPAAHARLQQMDADRETHAQAVVEQLSPPVEALVPLETGHRVLAVESLSDAANRGEPTDAETWDCYREQLRPGECLGIHLTRVGGRKLEALCKQGFTRRAAAAPRSDVADARWNVLHCWVHAQDIGSWGRLSGRASVVAMALPRPFTLVGSYTVAPDGTRLTYETELMVEYDAYRAALAATPTAIAPTHTTDTLLGTG